jgi:hypothetical protein
MTLNQEDVDFLAYILASDGEDDPVPDPSPPIKRAPPQLLIPTSPIKMIKPSPRSPSAGSGSGRHFTMDSSRRPCSKCVQLYVGGPDLREGITPDIMDPHFCSNLFCIGCDHKVIRFTDRKWKEGTDYLFLRNNYPDRVGQNLVKAPRWAACCCQCTFCSDQSTRKLPTFSTKWVCRGHQ